MFWQRLITAILLIPLVLLVIFYFSPWIMVELLVLVGLACGWEWFQLVPVKRNLHKAMFIGALIIAFGLADILGPWLLIPGLFLWMLIFLAEITYPQSQKYWGHPFVVTGLAMVLLPLFLQSMMHVYLHSQGKMLFLYMLLSVWVADSGAYFAGKLWGKHKLIPAVSPGKSVEGLVGAFILSIPLVAIGWFYFKPPLYTWVILNFLMFAMSVIGDLSISMLKRRVHIKDTGNIIPGHGGILDRLDSLIAVSPIFYGGLIWYLPGI